MSEGLPRALVLASASSRREGILVSAGYAVTAVPSAVDETWPAHADLREGVRALALRKARAVAQRYPHVPVLGADTEVAIDGCPVGKPAGRPDAVRILARLSGRAHTVVTAVALLRAGREYSGVAESRVVFNHLSDTAIDHYLRRADYADKAGAYGIQEEGAELVSSYSGRLDTIVGLPLDLVESLWERMLADIAC